MSPLDFASLTSLHQRLHTRPVSGAVLFGVVAGLVELALACLSLVVLASALPRSAWGPSAAASIGQMSSFPLFVVAVLFIPIWETLLAQALPMEIIRRIGGNQTTGVIVSVLLFSGGHFVNGGLAHGLTTLISGVVLALSYAVVRCHGFLPSFVVASTAHATANFALLFVIAEIAPQWA